MADEYLVKIKISEIQGDGKCPYGHKPGEVFSYPEDRGKICPTAYHIMFPAIRVMQFGGAFPWCPDPDIVTLCCSDPKRPVVFEITRRKK
jgi:uncharacterized repeat protein (TIGR04076 family)